jgi:hypothetical protein
MIIPYSNPSAKFRKYVKDDHLTYNKERYGLKKSYDICSNNALLVVYEDWRKEPRWTFQMYIE